MTLNEIQLRLGVPQHVLIHLCEKGVIERDFADTSRRGKRREFSRRNLFEFGVALTLRQLELPVAITGLLVRVLRSPTQAVEKAAPKVELLDALAEGSIDLGLQFYDGSSSRLVNCANETWSALKGGSNAEVRHTDKQCPTRDSRLGA